MPVLPFLVAGQQADRGQTARRPDDGLWAAARPWAGGKQLKDLAGLAIFHAFPARGGAFVLLTIVVAVLVTYMMVCVISAGCPRHWTGTP